MKYLYKHKNTHHKSNVMIIKLWDSHSLWDKLWDY